MAKAWNLTVLLLLGGGIGYGVFNATYNSPNAVADRKLAAAQSLIQRGEIVEAAQTYRDVVYGESDRVEEARRILVSMHKDEAVTKADLTNVARVMDIELATRHQNSGDPIGKSVSEVGMDLVDQRGLKDLEGSSEIFQIIAPVVQDQDRFNAVRLTILEKLVQTQPDNVQYASQLCEGLEANGDMDRCESLLIPHRDKLGSTEGARILGQVLADKGKIDEAHRFLKDYCEVHLGDLNAADSRFRSVLDSEQQRIIKELESGKASRGFYTRYDRASEEKQNEMVNDYISQKLKNNRKFDDARLAYTKETAVVPVALDLGMVQLRRAQAMQDAEKRTAELKAAEQTFVSISSVVGESDEYRLYMGQVNYWLGKYDEGRELFEKVLDANGRKFNILVGVSGMVREVGRTTEATNLIEEAYEKSKKPFEKHQAAAMRSSMADDNDDRILWLQRADTSKPSICAALKSAKGSKAAIEDDFDQAERLYRESIAAYDQIPEDISQLNNSGLTCFSLYRISGDKKDFDEGLRRLEKAISLKPADSILRYNASLLVLSAAHADIVGDAIDFGVMRSEASDDSLPFLYDDIAGKQPVIEKLRAHGGVHKAIDLMENVLLLAPKKVRAYASLAEYHGRNDDANALAQLREKIIKAKPEIDLTEIKDYLNGSSDPKILTTFQNAIAHREKALANSERGSLTRSVAIADLIRYQTGLNELEPIDDWDPWVQLAKESYESQRCMGTRSAYVTALAARAHQRLIENETLYRKHTERCGRTLQTLSALSVFISQSKSNSEIVHGDPDIQKATQLLRETFAAFPNSPSPWQWAWVKHQDPELANKLAVKVKESDHSRLSAEIGCLLSPASMSHAVDLYFLHLSQGNAEAAIDAMHKCAKHDIPLPFDVPDF